MSPSSAATSKTAEPAQGTRTYPPLPLTLALCVVLNTVVALSLWLLVPAMGSLGSTMVYSQCVGLAITLCSVAIGRLFGLVNKPPPLGLAMMLVPAAPIGYLLGHELARRLLGRPISLWGPGPIGSAALLATVLATSFAGYVLWMRQRLAREAQAREEAQRLATESQLRLLRAQLEPHMLFNTLANLRELMALDVPAAQRMLDSLIVYLRATLAATRSERSTLAQEFAQLGAYLDLMSVRMGPRLTWRAELPDDLCATPVPPLLLQPLVENAIRHGLEPQVGAGSILLKAEREAGPGGAVCISVVDSGRGLPAAGTGAPERAPPADDDPSAEGSGRSALSGYGLTHVRERLQSVYGAAASFTLEPAEPRGLRACVRIPA